MQTGLGCPWLKSVTGILAFEDEPKATKREKESFDDMKRTKQFFDQIEYWIFRLFLLALLLIAAYQVLEVHIGRFLRR